MGAQNWTLHIFLTFSFSIFFSQNCAAFKRCIIFLSNKTKKIGDLYWSGECGYYSPALHKNVLPQNYVKSSEFELGTQVMNPNAQDEILQYGFWSSYKILDRAITLAPTFYKT